MFERFTNQSRRVVVLAQEEARLLNHNYIGTEHLLLGLLREGGGSAARVLRTTDVTLTGARDQVAATIGRGQGQPSGHIPFTPGAKKTLELSLREALQLGDRYIGTGHLLLALIHQGDDVAVTMLGELGADLEDLRARVTQELREHPEEGKNAPPAERERQQLRMFLSGSVQELLDTIDNRLSAIERRLGITRPESAAAGVGGADAGLAGEDVVGAGSGSEAVPGEVAGEDDELTSLRARVARLEGLLREHGLDPEELQEPPAAAG